MRSGQLASTHELKGKGQEQYHLEGDDEHTILLLPLQVHLGIVKT